MRHILLFMLAILLIAGLNSCKEKKDNQDIITKMPQKENKPSGPLTMSAGAIPPKTVNWLGDNYTIKISRMVDKDLPLIEDASGNKYYDNKVRLSITRSDGSSFFDRVYTRNDFSKYTNESITKKWGLTGFNFDTVDGNKLLFAIAIGSPDEMADNEFVPLTLNVDSNGGTSVTSQGHGDEDEEEDEDAE